VGHALYTPAEGWHDAISNRGANFKGFLNVVEDARIEKKIRRKYPGLRNSFVKGYQSLIDNNFFEVKDRDLNELCFIDRVNIHTKLGSLVDIKFAEGEEQDLLNQVEACETWNDVLRVTEAIFSYSKEEQYETLQKLIASQMQAAADRGEEFDSDDLFDSESDGEEFEEGTQSVGEQRKPSDNGNEGEVKQASGESNEDDSEEDESSQIHRFKNSSNSYVDQTNFEPTCETDKSFRKNEGTLLDEQCKPYLYLKLPTPILENIITPVKDVQKFLGDYYDKYEIRENEIQKAVA
jgi:hypothetical protein